MAIQNIKEAQDLKRAGEQLGRTKLAARVVELIDEFDGSYISAIVLAGRMKAIAQACKFDMYWEEKAGIGYYSEMMRLVREGSKQ